MDLLAFKLLLTPLLLLAASLAVRRWGETVGGFVVGLPLTSGPISLFLALERGPAFAAQATAGSLVATAAQAAFGLVYVRLAPRGWPAALALGCAAFVAVALVLQHAALPQAALFIVAVAAIQFALWLSPRGAVERARVPPPWWDLPARMLLIAALIVGVTAVAPLAGPRISGVLASFPFMGLILTVFAHRMAGTGAAQQVMRGMVAGLFGFALFFFVLGLLLPRSGLAAAYALAVLAALLAQALTLRRLRRAAGGGRRAAEG